MNGYMLSGTRKRSDLWCVKCNYAFLSMVNKQEMSLRSTL